MESSASAFEILTALVGKEVALTEWVTIDQPRINNFAECTDDHQWIHVDPERASKELPTGTTIAHGFLTLSLLAGLSTRNFQLPFAVKQSLNYGLDKVRFLAPVPCGARIRDRIVLKSVEAKEGGRLLVATDHTVEIEGYPKPALIATLLGMVTAE